MKIDEIIEILTPVFHRRAKFWCRTDPENISDLIQDSFLAVIKGFHTIKGDRIEAWGQRVMDNCRLQNVRKGQQKIVVHQIPVIESSSIKDQDQDERIMLAEILSASKCACRKAIISTIFRLFMSGCDQNEVSSIVGLTPRQCRVRKAYMIRRIKARLNKRKKPHHF